MRAMLAILSRSSS